MGHDLAAATAGRREPGRTVVDAGFAGGARNAETRGAAARGRRFRQSPAHEFAAAMRSDGGVFAGAGRTIFRDARSRATCSSIRPTILIGTRDCRRGRSPIPARLRCARRLAPAQTDYLYFVANTEGGHFFSKTLAEHNRNVARYRKLLAAEAQSGAAPRPRAAAAKPHRRGRHEKQPSHAKPRSRRSWKSPRNWAWSGSRRRRSSRSGGNWSCAWARQREDGAGDYIADVLKAAGIARGLVRRAGRHRGTVRGGVPRSAALRDAGRGGDVPGAAGRIAAQVSMPKASAPPQSACWKWRGWGGGARR